MHILFLSRLAAPHVGGVEKHVTNVSTYLHQMGHRIDLITTQHSPNLPMLEKVSAGDVRRLPFSISEKKMATWWWIWQQRQLFKQVDVVHVHDVFWWTLPVWLIIRKKVYITFHGYEGNYPLKWKQIFWHRLAAHLARKNICVGAWHAKWYGVRADKIVFGAVDNLAEQPRTLAIKSKKINGNYALLFLGRLASDTGIVAFLHGLQTWQLLGAPKWRLDIFGDGELLGTVSKLVQKWKLPVKLHGFDTKASSYINRFDLVLASRYLSILEALTKGKQVVAVAMTPLDVDYLSTAPFAKWIEIIDFSACRRLPSGELVDNAELRQAVARLAAALARRLGSRLPAAAAQWAAAQTWQKMAKTYLDLWQS